MKNKELLEKIINSLSYPFYVVNAQDYKIEIVNSAFSARFGDMPKILNSTCYALTHKRDKPCTGEDICPLREVIKTKKPVITEHIHYDKDGNPRYMEVHGDPIFDEKGEVAYMIEYSLDITERKRIEAERRQYQERFRGIFNSSTDAIRYSDLNGVLLEVNDAFCRLTGYTKEELLSGRKYQDLTPEEYYEYEANVVNKVLKTGEPVGYEKELIRKDGSRVPLSLTAFAVRDASGKISGLAAIIKDITLRRQAEKEITEAALRLSRVIESVNDGITVSDRDGHFEIFNSRIQEITGYSMEEVRHCADFSCLIYPDSVEHQRALSGLNEVLQNSRYRNVETIIQAKDGTKKVLLVSTSLIEYKDRQMFLSVYRDITGQKQNERKLKEAKESLENQARDLARSNEEIKFLYQEILDKNKELQKLDQLKSDFVSTVSHELRTPLTVIREAISQVLDGVCGEINKEQKQFLFMSIEGIDRLSRLIENLLDISKIEAHKIGLKRELIDIVSLAKEVSSDFASAFQSKGLETKYNFPKERIELCVDKDRIIQIFVNLMSNALKFTPAGYVEISIVDKENVVECAVSDTGIGISDEDLPRVFSKFEQFGREFEFAGKGTGLGLAISRGIIELHRGKIWVESKLDQGTKISFTLPKYSTREAFKEYVSNGLAEAIKEGASLSVIIFEVKNYDTLQEKLGQDKIASIMHSLEQFIKTDLRRKSDISIKDNRAILVMLLETDKKGVWSTAERFKSSFYDYLSKEGLAKEIEVDLRVASFPEDAKTEEELLNKVQL